MNTTYLFRSVGLVASLLGLASLTACGSGSNSVSSPTATAFSAKSNAITFVVVDNSTGATVQNATLALSSSLSLYDAQGNAVTSVTATNGVATVYASSQGVVRAVASVSGYLQGSNEVTVSNNQTVGTISVISTTTPGTGVTATKGTATSGSSLSLSSTTASVTSSGSAVSIKDASGSAVSSISLTVAGIDVSTAASSIPGSQAVGSGDTAKPIQFGAVGVLQAGTTSAARTLRSAATSTGSYTFSPAVTLTLNVPTTGAFKSGDSVKVYWLPTGSSIWQDFGKKAYVNSDLTVKISANATGAWAVGQTVSTGALTVSLPNLSGYDVVLDFSLTTGWKRTVHTAGDTSITINGLPLGKGFTVVASLSGSTLKYVNDTAFSAGAKWVVGATAPANLVSVTASLACSESGTSLPSFTNGAGFSVQLLNSAGVYIGSSVLSDTATKFSGLTSGATYKYLVNLSSGDITGSFTATSGSTVTVTIPCSSLSSKTTGASGS